jgi:hypothetical protein
MWPYALGLGLSGLGGLAAGLLTSSSLGQKDRSSDWSGKGWGLGTLAGVGTGLALASPALYYEYQASKNADKWVGKDKDKWKRRGRLGAAFGSYLAAATVPGIVGAALGSMK